MDRVPLRDGLLPYPISNQSNCFPDRNIWLWQFFFKNLTFSQAPYINHYRPQGLPSFWSALKFATSGKVQHRKSAMLRKLGPLGGSNFLSMRREFLSYSTNPISYPEPTSLLVSAKTRSSGIIIRVQDFRSSGFTAHACLGLHGVQRKSRRGCVPQRHSIRTGKTRKVEIWLRKNSGIKFQNQETCGLWERDCASQICQIDSKHARSDGKSMNCGHPVLDFHKGCEFWCCQKRARPLGTKMYINTL